MTGHLLDRRGPPWFDFTRRAALFVVGLYVILYAVHSGQNAALLVTGLILTSIIPIEDVLRQLTRAGTHRREDRTMTETDRPDDDAGVEILDAGDDDTDAADPGTVDSDEIGPQSPPD